MIAAQVSAVGGDINLGGQANQSDSIEIDPTGIVRNFGFGAIGAAGLGSPFFINGGSIQAYGGSISLTANGTAAIGDDLGLANGAIVTTQLGSALLRARGDFSIDAMSSLTAPGGTFTIIGAYKNASTPDGSSIAVLGTLKAGSPGTILGGPGGDYIQVTPVAATGFTVIPGGGVNNELIAPATISGPVNISLSAGQGASDALTVLGTSGPDAITVNATSTVVNGHPVNYNQFLGAVFVQGLAGGDAFNVYPSTTATIGINGGLPKVAPGDTLSFFQPAGQTSTLTNQTVQSGTFQTTGGYQPVNYGGIETVIAPNRPPVNTVPSSITANKNVSLSIVGLSVTDPDAGSSPIQMTLSVQHGTLSIATNVIGGVTAGQVTVTSNGSVVLIASQAQIDTTLAAQGLVYTPSSGFFGVNILVVTSNDLGNTGTGGPLIGLQRRHDQRAVRRPAAGRPDQSDPGVHFRGDFEQRPGHLDDQQHLEAGYRDFRDREDEQVHCRRPEAGEPGQAQPGQREPPDSGRHEYRGGADLLNAVGVDRSMRFRSIPTRSILMR